MKNRNVSKKYVGRSVYYRRAEPVHVPYRRNHRTLAVLLTVAGLLIGGFIFWPSDNKQDTPESVASVKAAKTYTPSDSQIAAMDAKIKETIRRYPGIQVSVAIQTINGDTKYQYGVTNPYDAASVGKLITAIDYLRDVEAGRRTMNQKINGIPATDAMRLMIEQSDNAAWEGFNGLIGHPELERYAQSVGLTNYDADTNTVTSSDVATLLAKLYQKKLLNSQHTGLLLSFMKNANEREHIVEAIGSSAIVYHKAGWLDDRVHDTAIVDDGSYPYVLVIFTKMNYGTFNKTAGQDIYKSITETTTQTFIENKN